MGQAITLLATSHELPEVEESAILPGEPLGDDLGLYLTDEGLRLAQVMLFEAQRSAVSPHCDDPDSPPLCSEPCVSAVMVEEFGVAMPRLEEWFTMDAADALFAWAPELGETDPGEESGSPLIDAMRSQSALYSTDERILSGSLATLFRPDDHRHDADSEALLLARAEADGVATSAILTEGGSCDGVTYINPESPECGLHDMVAHLKTLFE